MGRDFAFFSPAFPEQSATFNPFGTCENTTELAARVQALMPGGGAMSRDPFFTEYPLAIIERLGAAQRAIGEKWTIEGLNAVATLLPPFQDLIARYLHEVVFERDGAPTDLNGLIEEYGRLEGGRRDLLADALLDDYGKPRDHFQKVTANLTPAFRGVTGGRMAGLLSSAEPKLTWHGIVKNETVVYFAMNSLMFGEVANRMGRVILQDLIGYLGRRYAYDDPIDMTPITILLDEFSNIAYPGFIDALNKGGGARAHFMLAMQSLADPEAAMGKDGTQRVLDNLNTRIWFRLSDDRTAKVATEGLGMANVSHAQVGYSLGFRRQRTAFCQCRRRYAARREAADSSGVADGHAEGRGPGAAQGRELEAAGAAAGAGRQGRTRGGRRTLRPGRGTDRLAGKPDTGCRWGCRGGNRRDRALAAGSDSLPARAGERATGCESRR